MRDRAYHAIVTTGRKRGLNLEQPDVLGKNKYNEQMQALEACIDEGLIEEVHSVIKSGKEATVYLCERRGAHGDEFVAAKVYRTTDVRRFANDAVYRGGRMHGYEHTHAARAMKRKRRVGRELAFQSWVSDEYATLELLHRAGADVPAPIAQHGSVVLMEYVSDAEGQPAMVLANARLSAAQADAILRRLVWNIELMLVCDRVHGDLSAYNVLYAGGGTLRIIDFPQAVDARFNQASRELLERDLERVITHLVRQGATAPPVWLARSIWERFLRAKLDPAAPPPLAPVSTT